MERLIKKIKINTTITLLTGLHIGGNSNNVEIGGIDTPVIKTAIKKNQPYIPGSSLKGKIRCLLEQINGSTSVGGNKKVNNLFGYSKDNNVSKIIFRDSYLTEDSLKLFKDCDFLDMPYTEGKWENVIDRVQGIADPRLIERVPAGVKFDVEMIINIWDDDNQEELIALLEEGIEALENDYLGGNGSRGYGQVVFGDRKIEEITFD